MAVSPPRSYRRSTQGPPAPKFEIRAGSKSSKLSSQTFQTPITPGPSSRTRDHSVNGTRKRTRPGPSPVQNTPWSVNTSDWTNVSATGSIARSDAMSPLPFVNTTYVLKGGMETPNQDLEHDLGDNEFRRRWDVDTTDSDNTRLPALSSNNTPSNGWGKVVFNFAGTVAGKMWNFCTVPFSGFYAGGGQGVALNTDSHQSLQQASTTWDAIESKHTPFEEPFFNRIMTPIPGQYPTDDPFTAHDTTPPRPAKRIHTDHGASWMLVPLKGEGECESASRCNSPARLSERKTPSQSHIPRPSLPSQFSVSHQSLPRRSLIPVSRRSSLTANQSPSVRPASRQSSYFPANNISPRPRTYTPMNPFNPYDDERPITPIQAPHKENATPLSPEVEEYAARMRYEEEVADESMRNMHQRLQDLIREGQKALKSNYASEDRDDEMMGYDEGFQDGVY